MRKKSISVESRLSSGRVESQIDVSDDLKKYFRSFDFYSSYDAEITPVNGILNIPALSLVLPIAWITGADVYVNELDETFAASMEILQAEYKKIYPNSPFKTRLKVGKFTKSENAPEGTALLFSGGLDSTYTLYNNLSLKPRLIMLFGVADIPVSNTEFQEKLKAEYSTLAKREGLKINFIQTNALELIDRANRVQHLWERFQRSHEVDFWNGIGFSLGHICQAAPLSISRFDKLIISSALNKTTWSVRERPNASSPDTDEKIAWANLSVEHEGSCDRYEKVAYLKELLNGGKIKLRVCWSSPEHLHPYTFLNCGKCEKCLRTIAALCYSGVDPNKCGFNIDDSNFSLMRFMLEGKLLTKSSIEIWWKPLQRALPEEVREDFHGSKNFFSWFRNANLDLMTKQPNSLRPLLTMLPYPIWHTYKIIYGSIFPHKVVWKPITSEKYER